MTDGFLSDRAQRLFDYVESGAIGTGDLIRAYSDWKSSPGDAGDDEVNPIVADVRRRLGIRDPQADALEAVGDAIRMLVRSDDAAAKDLWHDTKVAALGGNDHDKKLTALRHLDAEDFADEACIAAFLEGLADDDHTLALSFAFTAGTTIDPVTDGGAIRALFDELKHQEVRRSASAAVFGTAIAQIFEHHPSAVPSESIVDEWVATLMNVDDAFSYAPATEVAAYAISRGDGPATLGRWLSSPSPRLWLFGMAVVNQLGEEWRNRHRAAVSPMLSDLMSRARTPGPADDLHPAHRRWLLEQLHACNGAAF